jgi:hypothetical protein
MTRHERLTLGVSVAALVISVASPFLNYYWFQSEVRVQQLKSEALHAEGTIYICDDQQTMIYEITLKNTGLWPIQRIHLTMQKSFDTIRFDGKPYKPGNGLKFAFDKKNIRPDLGINISIREKDSYLLVNFKDAMPPKIEMVLADFVFKNVPHELLDMLPDLESMEPSIWLSSQVSSFDVFWDMKTDCPTVERIRRGLAMQ